MTSTAATNELLGSTRTCVLSGGEVRRSEWVDDLFNTRTVEWDLLVIGITEMSERELVVTALIRLESNFATRTSDGLDQVARGLLVLLEVVIHLEGTGTTENERCRDTGVARTSERISMMHVYLRNHPPLVNLLPLNLCTGEGISMTLHVSGLNTSPSQCLPFTPRIVYSPGALACRVISLVLSRV
jgi:hypothetical protein